jgi:hypothetical protein
MTIGSSRVSSEEPGTGVRLTNQRTNQAVILGADHIHHFTSDTTGPISEKRGFLELSVKLEIKLDKVEIEPILSGPARLPKIVVSSNRPSAEVGKDGDIWLQTSPGVIGQTIFPKTICPPVFDVMPRGDSIVSRVTLVSAKGSRVQNATVVAIADNNTTKEALSDVTGVAELTIATRRQYQLLIAHSDYPAAIISGWESKYDLRVTLSTSGHIGSIVCHGTGHVPGLQGRLNPIRDVNDRTYIYADNIAVDGGRQQPVLFQLGTPMEMEDCNGVVMHVRVLEIRGSTSLLEFART